MTSHVDRLASSSLSHVDRLASSSLRVAIVGTGNIARIHVEALRSLGDRVEVVAAVDVDTERLAEFGARHGIADRHTDLTAMLARARPDLVHICTPPGAHLGPALACLAAGASVLVEKPPTLSLRDLDTLAAAQGAGGPWVATVFQSRFGSGARRLRALLDAGVLGRPLLAVCHTTWYRDQAYFDVPWRGRWDTEGGGPTMGHGIHQMDLLLAVLGDWVEVSAVVRRQARRTETEDLSLAHVSFSNGAVASVVNSVLSPREETYLRFDFERATVELTHLYGYSDDDWRITPGPGFEQPVLEAWKAAEAGRRSGHDAQVDAVVASLEHGTPPPVTTGEAARTMRLVAGIYASAFTGRAVRPAELGPGSPFYERMSGDGPQWSRASVGLGLVHEEDRSLRVTWDGAELMRYVYRPRDPRLESPRPYLHPVRTLGGDLVSLYRPHDHLWHKGIAWSLSNVTTAAGTQNFWGGPTYLRDGEYQQLANNGEMAHDRFDVTDVHDGAVRVDEALTWRTEDGSVLIAERRELAVTVMPEFGAWQLAIRTTMRNVSGGTITIGSPTTEGRDNAGYSGLFWRGPRAFSGGRVLMSDREGGDDLRGRRGPWLAFVGRHDGNGRSSSVLFRDDPENLGYPTRWFVRSELFAGVCPAPFFARECVLVDGAGLSLRYDVVVVDGAVDAETCARLAVRAGAFELGEDR